MSTTSTAPAPPTTGRAAPRRIESGYGRMWQIAWPVSVSTSTVTLFMIANLFWVGYLGTEAVAAVSACGHFLFIIFGLTHIVFVGTLAMVSRRVGAGDLDDAYFAGVHAVILGALFGSAVAVAGWFAAPWIVGFFDTTDAVTRLAIPYLQVTLAGEVFLFVSMAVGASYSGAGDTWTPMLLNGVAVTLNTLIDPLFIFGPGDLTLAGVDVGWLGWGVYGAAVADVVAAFVGMCAFVGVTVLLDRPFPRPRGARLVLRRQTFWQIIRIGVPASISLVARPLSTFFLIRVIASFGTAALAAFGIALRAFSINWIPYSGLTAAISALVGQNLGARDVGEAEGVVARGVRVALVVAAGICLMYGWFAAEFISFFDSDPEVVATGVPFVKLIAFGFLASGATVPLVAAMNGAGDTRPPMIVAFIANWPIKLPLCWALAIPFGYGTNGVWVGMLVSILVEAGIIAWWFRRGSWKTRAV